jgi:cytochrome oxidase assembly protein ShyY1
VLTLFRPDGARSAVLVDRGFLALPPDRRVPAIAAPREPAVVTGMLAPPPAAGVRLGDAHAVRGSLSLLPWLDPRAIANDFHAKLADAIVLLDADAADGFERRWEPLRNTLPPERHRAYAVQWLALAAAVWITYGVLTWRQRRKK